jgi:hypothetical protein
MTPSARQDHTAQHGLHTASHALLPSAADDDNRAVGRIQPRTTCQAGVLKRP